MKRTYHATWRSRFPVGPSGYVRLKTPTDVIVCLKAAHTFSERLLGLIPQDKVAQDSGLIIEGCRAVHTMGMRVPIDLVFFDHQLKVVKVVGAIGTGRIAFCSAAYGVIELASGSIHRLGLAPGMHLRPLGTDAEQFCWVDSHPSAAAVSAIARMSLVGLLISATTACSTANFAGISQRFSVQPVAAERVGGEPLITDSAEDGPSDQSISGTDRPSAIAELAPRQLSNSNTNVSLSLSDDLKTLQADAERSYQSGKLTEALAAFTRIAQARPDNRTAWLRIGNIHHQRGVSGQAMRAYRQAARGGDTDSESVQIRAKALFNIAVIGLEQAGWALESLSVIPVDARLARESAGLERTMLDQGKMLGRERDRLQGPLSTSRMTSRGDSAASSIPLNRSLREGGPALAGGSSIDSGETARVNRPAPVELIRGQISP